MDTQNDGSKNVPEMQNPLVRQTEEEIRREKKRERERSHYAKNAKKFRVSRKRWRKANYEKYLESARRSYRKRRKQVLQDKKKYYVKNREKILEKIKNERILHPEIARAKDHEKHRRLKLAICQAYGGPICKCCGETEFDFLSLDHTQNNGSEHRKQVHAASLYSWLKRKKFPPGFQVLCLQCNFAKGMHGTCPHERMKTPIDLFFEKSS